MEGPQLGALNGKTQEHFNNGMDPSFGRGRGGVKCSPSDHKGLASTKVGSPKHGTHKE